jgi:N-acetylmuramoyl-L-alanine amidase
MARIIIDAGHGGTSRAGSSSAYGSRGATGLLEKDVTLDIARHVVARLGGDAALTRTDDSNLPLGARAAQAVRDRADVFVSIHANSGPPEMSGPETWVHPEAGADSHRLAGGIQRALERLGGRLGGSAESRRGPMAVLDPGALGRSPAACLIEVDYLTNPRGERRLGDPGERAAIGAAIAGAIREHVGERRYGQDPAAAPSAAEVIAPVGSRFTLKWTTDAHANVTNVFELTDGTTRELPGHPASRAKPSTGDLRVFLSITKDGQKDGFRVNVSAPEAKRSGALVEYTFTFRAREPAVYELTADIPDAQPPVRFTKRVTVVEAEELNDRRRDLLDLIDTWLPSSVLGHQTIPPGKNRDILALAGWDRSTRTWTMPPPIPPGSIETLPKSGAAQWEQSGATITAPGQGQISLAHKTFNEHILPGRRAAWNALSDEEKQRIPKPTAIPIYTSCNDVMRVLLNEWGSTFTPNIPTMTKADPAYYVKAIDEFAKADPRLPKPGDILYLSGERVGWNAKEPNEPNRESFQHVCILVSRSSEIWVTADGGGGVIPDQTARVVEKPLSFTSAKQPPPVPRLFSVTDGKQKALHGWVDLDRLVNDRYHADGSRKQPGAIGGYGRAEAGPAMSAAQSAALPTWIDLDAAGLLWIPRWQPDWEIGFVDARGAGFVGVVNGQPFEPLSLAGVGALETGDRPAGDSIVLVEEVALTPSAAGGAPPGSTRLDVRLTHHRSVRTWHGRAAIVTPHGSSFRPIDPAHLDPQFAAALDERARIKLRDGSMWIWMSFSLSDEPHDTARWVPPGHPRADVDHHTRAIDAELARLPAGDPLQIQAIEYRNIMIAVATHEGSFGAASGSGDTHASLGMFQWAMEKGQTAESGSLGRFFRDLEHRARAAAAPPGAMDRLFIDAWAECTAAGLSLAGDQIRINGAVANGEVVEAHMRSHMARGHLRTYQLVAAIDWIEQFRTTAIRPGPSVGRRIAGNGYTQTRSDGLHATLTHGHSTFEFDATQHRTVGELLGSTKALATAITLGVNRPHFVEASAWKVMAPQTAEADVAAALQALAAELTGHGAHPLPRRVTREVVWTSTEAARLQYQAIERILWPLDLPAPALEWRTVADFRRHALKLYNAGDARRYHRERRFSTLELMTW